MRGVGGPLLTIGDLLSDLAVEGGDGPLVGVGDVSAPSSPAASQQAEKDDPSDLSRLFEVVGEIQSSLDRVRRRLSSTSTRHLLQGPLLKRSDTLRKWNERWVILDPTTWKIEYKVRRSDKDVRGVILFDSTSTVTLSPMNFHGLAKYDGCCFYIGTPQKKEYFLCAETPSAARAWVRKEKLGDRKCSSNSNGSQQSITEMQ